jgi:hypothetical protein
VIKMEEAPEALKMMMQDCFEVPICKLKIDENSKEIKRSIVAGPGAEEILKLGQIANAMFFHPPFKAGLDKWDAEREISMGQGGYAKGKLTYEKGKADKEGLHFKVTGTLTNDDFQPADSPVGYKDARYVIVGEQSYDPAKKEWISGKMHIDVSFKMRAFAASAKGTILMQLESVPKKK